jgi:DNA-binding MarR family transcriptional regulator
VSSTVSPSTAGKRVPSRSSRADADFASTLRIAIMRLRRRLNNQRAADHLLSANQLSAMGTLKRLGAMTIGELAAHERVRPPSMTRTVNSMEELGLVARAPHPTDRRQVLVTLADEGKRILDADRRRRDAWLARQLHQLTPEEKEILRRAAPILERLAASS